MIGNSKYRHSASSRAQYIFVLLITCILCVLVAVAAYTVYTRHVNEQALSSCQDALSDGKAMVSRYDTDRKNAQDLLISTGKDDVSDQKLIEQLTAHASDAVGDVVKGKHTDTKQIADAQRIIGSESTTKERKAAKEILKKAAQADSVTFEDCEISEANGKLNQTAKTAKNITSTIQKADKTISSDVHALTKDMHDTLKSRLAQAIVNGKKLLADSAGKVADEKTRSDLTNTLDSASKVQKDRKATVNAYRKALDSINKSVTVVNDSIKAKSDAGGQQDADTSTPNDANQSEQSSQVYDSYGTWNSNSSEGDYGNQAPPSSVGPLSPQPDNQSGFPEQPSAPPSEPSDGQPDISSAPSSEPSEPSDGQPDVSSAPPANSDAPDAAPDAQ